LLALGSETNSVGIPGVAEHTLGIKTLGDAVMIRAGVINSLESASVEPDPDQRKRMLTFVVVGGGFAGVETVGAINDLARDILPHYGQIDPREVRVVLIHGGGVILPELGDALGRYAQEKLTNRQVEIKLNTRVISYAGGAVHCSGGGQLAAIGRRTGVARIFGFKFSGVVGWVLWRTVYLMKLPRLEKKLRVGLQWALDVVFRRDLGQYITLQDVESLNRLLEAARQSDGIPPETSAPSSQHADSSKKIAS